MREGTTKDVMISILGSQEYEEEEMETVELTTAGTLTRTRGGYRLAYHESELTGMEGTLTCFDIMPGRVTLIRTGLLNSEMVFERGVRHLALYSTPYGDMEISVAARTVDSTINEAGGELNINYSIEIDHQMAGENQFSLKVRDACVAL